MQVDTRHNYDGQLRNLLHVIATQTDVEASVSLILQSAVQITGASGASFRSFGEPILTLTVGADAAPDLTAQAAAQIDSTLFDPTTRMLVCPVRTGSQLLGVLTLSASVPLGDHDLLSAVIDGLAIVISRAHDHMKQKQMQQWVRSLLDSLLDPLLIFDEDGLLLLTNLAAAAIFGARAVPGKKFEEIVQSEELIAFVEGKHPLNEWGGGDQVFAPRIQPLGDASDGWILVLRDITQYKKLNRSQNEFIRIVSHDIRSPLTSMRGFAEMIGMAGELTSKQGQFVEKVLSGVTQITALVDNIQDAGRFDIETGFYEMTRAQCDLRDMTHRIVENQLIPDEKHDLKISVSVADDVPIINGDSTMLERAITNLVDNAVKYTQNGGHVDVLVYTRDQNVVVSVRDDGLGISPENQKLLFQRHVRLARQEHKKIKGSGLGLFIVKSVAQRHGGEAWVDSVEGAGSTFSFNIPLKGANLVISDERVG